ncbi:proline-rich protein 18 [Centropristis striata]|uniref:proline-rich protein 18 n=1 Tax=Centropristis striata TaxID=184440 RepID=UPI0027DF8DBC|nr:proline-rich protein 18 [Centropristis striata]
MRAPVELQSEWTTGALQPPSTSLLDDAPLVALRRASSSSALWTFARFCILITSSHKMPFPPISLHQRISSPGRELFGKKKANGVPPHTELTSKSGGEKTGSDKEKQSSSWTSANLRNLGRKQEKTKSPSAQKAGAGQETQGKSSWLSVPKPQDSSEGVRRSSSMDSARHLQGKEEGKKEIQFTLSLTPEAILVIQKRNLEKQMMAKQQKCCASADFRHRRVFPSKKAHGASKGCAPVAKAESAEQDITAIVKISLLNDQYKYDDVEYEEEDGDVDETVVRKCKEWLKGVENAAALGKVDKLSALPHLKGC